MVFAIILSILGLLLLVTFIGIARKPAPSARIFVDGQVFPEGFLWSTGEDPYQHEGHNYNNDWYLWEKQTPSPVKNGDRCGPCIDFYNRYEEDFRNAADDGQNAHRIGVEWSRIEPEPEKYDEEALDHYRNMLTSLREKGFTVFLNLWHFTLPIWASRRGGWEDPYVFSRWEALVRRCAEEFGSLVDYWSTMIDAQIYALAGYAAGDIPPCVKDIKRAVTVYRRLMDAHGAAYHIIKQYAALPVGSPHPSPRVGMIYFFFYYEPRGFLLDRYVCRAMDNIFNWNMLDALHNGEVNISVPLGPSVKEQDPSLKGTLDWLGINYYTRQMVSINPFKPGFIEYKNLTIYPATDMGWEIYPEGLYLVTREAARRYPGVPLFVAESGLDDEKDRIRPKYILDHLAWTHRLIQEGLPVFGFTYWSLTDNWEWAEGFEPKFGLYAVDPNTMERQPRNSAHLFRFIARNNRLPSEEELKGDAFDYVKY